MHLGINDVFKKGDLFSLNESGKEIFHHITASVGVIVSEKKMMYEYDFKDKVKYYVYDILVSGQLFKDIPEEFLHRITQDEKDTK